MTESQRERLQAALALIRSAPDEASKQIWSLFKDMKKPDVKTETVVVHDHGREEELRQELQQARAQLRQKDLQLEQARAKKKPRSYDVDMIRDFLSHLLWAVRVLHFESTSKTGTINEELTEQLRPYFEKYGSDLLAATDIHNDAGLPERLVHRAIAYWKQARAQAADDWVKQLEALQPLFTEALGCAQKQWGPHQWPVCVIQAIDLLPPEEGGNPNSPFNRDG